MKQKEVILFDKRSWKHDCKTIVRDIKCMVKHVTKVPERHVLKS